MTAKSKRLKSAIPLKEYRLPADMKSIIRDLNNGSSTSKRKNLLEKELRMQEYAKRFDILLHLEEHEQTKCTRQSCLYDIQLTRSGELFIMKVEGFRQHFRSCLPGDQVKIWSFWDYQWHRATGNVHKINGDEVQLSFGKRRQKLFKDTMWCTVLFTISRLTTRIQHRAVELAGTGGLEKVLFPTGTSPTPSHAPPMELSLFDQTLNKEQSTAVHHIVAGSSKPAPYLVFGPPGTGKTVTLVEAIRQVEKTHASCHILACAHTNSAADLLCEKIMNPKVKVYRLYAKSQETEINQNLQRAQFNCNWGEGGIYIPDKEELEKHKIMVTTLFSASRLVTEGIPPGFYSHIFVDEAGQPAEPEGVIPLAGLLDPKRGQVVLAGDPKQLGPIVKSPLAKKHGLGVSMLERLMELNVYKKTEETGYNDRFITKLLRNYRSHDSLLTIPNELFYESELQVWADVDIRNSLCKWKHLPSKGFPLIFHEVTGRMHREDNASLFNASLFNEDEVAILMRYLKKLLEDVLPEDIGLIAPYRKQVERINKALKIEFPRNAAELKVGTVDAFQGVEKRVILLSTVRSTSRDPRPPSSVGFLADPKRFNVAMTRAQALLIVAGNSQALTKDSCWSRFIEYCKEHGGYTKTMTTD
ncbi:putative helicase mov-10-B.1 isoform X2 [Gadus chalcogrammus]|uniref:putative helicase mov-10-B.1 isoform X2 n=1 Tax=Gadus chalcogrammus TaxID=1042646 RepID=UPI0024C28729|nr:putative helicase mov-10-B.1 isoform X2 [Gadus chalcogrammus]